MIGVEPNLSNLEKAREAKGYSRQYMADKLNVTYTTYRNWETGETSIPLDKAKVIANIFNTKVDALFYSRVFRII